jgi:GT2 family glycosyltransferase
MTIHVLMPVHNRVDLTRRMLECLRGQIVDEAVAVTVIDDGSTDGTREFLRRQPGVQLVEGDGSLWWGGGIEAGLRRVLAECAPGDWVMFANNDTEIGSDFIQKLLDSARGQAPAAIGSVIRDVEPPHALLSVGAQIDPWRFVVRDRLDRPPAEGAKDAGLNGHLHEVDALSGRGALFPVAAFRVAGTMRARWLPHYFADYELSLRVRRHGYRLLVDDRAAVFSRHDYGSTRVARSARERFLSVSSPGYLPAKAAFWWQASSWMQRVTLPLRLVLFGAFPRLRNKH